MSLNQIIDYVQKKVNESQSHWSVSALLVLSDVDETTGLITNMNSQELNRLKISPSLESPVASVKMDSQGEGLFTFYLQLMQALQTAEARAFAPDYLEYAKTAGLGTINVGGWQTWYAEHTVLRGYRKPQKSALGTGRGSA